MYLILYQIPHFPATFWVLHWTIWQPAQPISVHVIHNLNTCGWNLTKQSRWIAFAATNV
jgi:hypothetical protein